MTENQKHNESKSRYLLTVVARLILEMVAYQVYLGVTFQEVNILGIIIRFRPRPEPLSFTGHRVL